VERVEHIHLEEGLIPYAISKERHAFDECDVADVDRLAIISIATVGGGKGMID
jgi:hypothetical protein